ncbi:L-threonylcarbamoyladenylate synthase [Rhabdothermincola salaria]|uniref:L-threonylcarbamoyladenylate synthase n=1 Tax=Rhabdothermincola salaria TaxID=2903142 RepID=UPI001E4665F0|nr:L-threonylcarbamoyladenylate synthase [Rhabdothermincola salaria]MCD9623763.1 threonylcarbamoyl-AMP synthase [Rhabdothermincola salaria]
MVGDDAETGDDAAIVDGEAGLDRAVAVLRDGGLVAFPTETVYGLGADAAAPDAVASIFTAKGRPPTHPLIVHLGDLEALDQWAERVPPEAHLLADAFWPGPLTMLLWRAPDVPDVVTGGRPTVGVRVPDHPVARALLTRFGGGVAAPSANRFGRVSPTTAAHVLSELRGHVDLILDGGPCEVGVESTIVDLTGAEAVVLRPGGVSTERLAEVLGREPAAATDAPRGSVGARAPGMLAAHYAPRARVEVLDEDAAAARIATLLAATDPATGHGPAVGLLAPGAIDGVATDAVVLEPVGPPPDYARLLYARLRQADRLGLDVVVCVPPPAAGIGVAVRDRLRRAAQSSVS